MADSLADDAREVKFLAANGLRSANPQFPPRKVLNANLASCSRKVEVVIEVRGVVTVWCCFYMRYACDERIANIFIVFGYKLVANPFLSNPLKPITIS